MEVARTRSVFLRGLEGALVEVEAHIAPGLPSFALTGLPDKACGQAPDRVRPALASSGIRCRNEVISMSIFEYDKELKKRSYGKLNMNTVLQRVKNMRQLKLPNVC